MKTNQLSVLIGVVLARMEAAQGQTKARRHRQKSIFVFEERGLAFPF
jgi:hypothetical protein